MKHKREFRKIAALLLLVTSLILISVVSRGKSSQEDITTDQVVVSGTWGKEPGQFGLKKPRHPEEVIISGPSTFIIDKQGNIYITDSVNHRVQKFDKNGKLLLTFGTQGTKEAGTGWITAIAVDSKGTIYVADTRNDLVKIFNSKGEYLSTISGSKDNKVRIRQLGRIYIDLEDNINIQAHNAKGDVVYKLSSEGELISFPKPKYKMTSGRIYKARKKARDSNVIVVEVYSLDRQETLQLLNTYEVTVDRKPSWVWFQGVDRFGNLYFGYGIDEPKKLYSIVRLDPKGKLLNLYYVNRGTYHYYDFGAIELTKNGDIYIMRSDKDKFWIEKIPYIH